MDDDYFSFEESSESDYDSFDIQDEDRKNFHKIHQNNQIETLKALRQALRQNKSLKHRLNILESELDRYQNFGSFSPVAGDMPQQSKREATVLEREASIFELKELEKESEELKKYIVAEKTTNDQYCQFDYDLIKENETMKQEKIEELNFFIKKSQTPDIKIIEKIVEIYTELPKPVVSEKECQTDEIIQEKEKIEQLNKKILKLESDHTLEIENLKSSLKEASRKFEESNNSLNVLQASFDLISLKLADSQRNVMKLTDENQTVKVLKQNLQQSQILCEQLYQDIQSKENELETKRKHLIDMADKFQNCTKTIEEHDRLIKKLQIDNEKHLKEKHLACQQKISELEKENDQMKEKLIDFETDNQKQSELIENFTKQIDRYKIEQQNFNFKEFVSLKRELNSLKQEKERNFANLVTTPKNSDVNSSSPTHPLPPIKDIKKNVFKFFQ